jgi:predicted ferric reductase
MAALLYALLAALPLLLWLFFGEPAASLTVVGEAMLLLAFPVLALEPLLAARSRLLDRLFGLDAVYLFHKAAALTALLLLLLHPVFRAAFAVEDPAAYLATFGQPWYVVLEHAALLLLMLQSAVALAEGALERWAGLRYESWKLAHGTTAGLLTAALAAQAFSGRAPFDVPAVSAAWLVLFALSLGAALEHRVFGPARRRHRPFRVGAVSEIAPGIWNIALDPPEGARPPSYAPGQFHFLYFAPGADTEAEEHPFTISSGAPSGSYGSTVKESGDFTRRLSALEAGTSVSVHGPFGRFSYVFHPEETKLVFIAGGIGITPFMSMLRHMRAYGVSRRVMLFYGARTEADLVFALELNEIAAEDGAPALSVTSVLSRADKDWTGLHGHVDIDLIRRTVGSPDGRTGFYLCGPPAMQAALIPQLYRWGVSPKRLHTERFST